MKEIIKKFGKIDNETYRFRKFMCYNCQYFQEECTKNRIARICAKQGLKNIP